jgi:hypothetical protein
MRSVVFLLTLWMLNEFRIILQLLSWWTAGLERILAWIPRAWDYQIKYAALEDS